MLGEILRRLAWIPFETHSRPPRLVRPLTPALTRGPLGRRVERPVSESPRSHAALRGARSALVTNGHPKRRNTRSTAAPTTLTFALPPMPLGPPLPLKSI